MAAPHVTALREDGYAIIRRFLTGDDLARARSAVDAVYAEGLKHHATWRDGNLCFEVLNDPAARRRIVIQAYWFAWINPVLEALRRDGRYFALLEPLLGPDIKQITNQLHWKPAGAKYTSYRFHQDLRFRDKPELFSNLATNYFTTGLAFDRQDAANGALQVFPGSHKRGYLGLSDEGETIMKGRTDADELIAAGLDPADAVSCELEPGDLLIWTLYTVHGSPQNRSDRGRCLMLNSYVRAADSPSRGEWAFRGGCTVPLGATPEICRFEDLHEHPEPFYIEDDWTGEQTRPET